MKSNEMTKRMKSNKRKAVITLVEREMNESGLFFCSFYSLRASSQVKYYKNMRVLKDNEELASEVSKKKEVKTNMEDMRKIAMKFIQIPHSSVRF